MKHHLPVVLLLAGSYACTKPPPAGKNCYHASTREEYDALIKVKAESPDTTIQVAGKDYDCVDNKPSDTGGCYLAKDKAEFDKLTTEQMSNPGMAVIVNGRSYDCLRAAE